VTAAAIYFSLHGLSVCQGCGHPKFYLGGSTTPAGGPFRKFFNHNVPPEQQKRKKATTAPPAANHWQRHLLSDEKHEGRTSDALLHCRDLGV